MTATDEHASLREHAPSPGSGLHASGIAAISTGVVLWATSNVLIKTASVGAVTFAVCRLWLGFAALVLAGVAARRRLTRAVVRASIPAGILFAVNIALLFEALRRSSVANVTLIGGLQPALVFIVVGRLFGERVTRWDLGWTALSIGGIVVVVFGSFGVPGWRPSGDLMAVGATVTWTCYFLASKHVRATHGTLEYFTAVLGIAAVALTPLMLALGGSVTDPSAGDWWKIAAVALGPGTGGHLLVTWAHRHVDVSVSSVIGVAQPVIAAAGAGIVLHEGLSALQIVGGLTTILAVGAVVGRRKVTEPELLPEGAA